MKQPQNINDSDPRIDAFLTPITPPPGGLQGLRTRLEESAASRHRVRLAWGFASAIAALVFIALALPLQGPRAIIIEDHRAGAAPQSQQRIPLPSFTTASFEAKASQIPLPSSEIDIAPGIRFYWVAPPMNEAPSLPTH